jgi:exosome complex RNA-binding protein Csl4
MITFNRDTSVEVVESYDSYLDGSVENYTEHFFSGENVSGQIIKDNGKFVDLQFEDGTIGVCVPRRVFEAS